jgi:uncharacterized Zn finger protein
MKTLTFLVQGSAPEPYEVVFTITGEGITATCSCPAGKNGQYCKHRVSILQGSTASIVSGNAEAIQTVLAALPGTAIEAALADFQNAACEFERAKSADASAKKALAAALKSHRSTSRS